MIKTFLAIAGGGAIGAMARYGAHVAFIHITNLQGIWGTLSINIIGSFAMGLLASVWMQETEVAKAFIAVGMLGGFTTFSTFSLDSLTLIMDGRIWSASAYILISVIASILALGAGLMITKTLVN